MEPYEVAIVGGGPGGSALALSLARSGTRVILFEKKQFPRGKLCGEFIAPSGVDVLENLGLLAALQREGAQTVRGFAVTDRRGRSLTGSFDQPGLGVSRRVLDTRMLARAEREGVQVRQGTKVVECRSGFDHDPPRHHRLVVASSVGHDGTERERRVPARLVVGAYGRRARIDHRLERGFMADQTPYVGFKRHFRGTADSDAAPLEHRVNLYLVRGGYCGLVRVGEDRINACMMIDADALDRFSTVSWECVREGILSTNEALDRRLVSMEPVRDAVQTGAQIPLCSKSCYEEPYLFVGDASGMIAPFTGNGQTIAMQTGCVLGSMLQSGHLPECREAFQQFGNEWERTWEGRFSARLRGGGLLNRVLMNGRVSSAILRVLRTVPILSGALIRSLIS